MEINDIFVNAVDALLTAAPVKRGGSSDMGSLKTQYWNMLPTNEGVWIDVETLGGETTSTVCGDDSVFTTPEKTAEALLAEIHSRLEEAGV